MSSNELMLKTLMASRQKIIDSSDDGIDTPECDSLMEDIRSYIVDYHQDLPVDLVIEGLTSIGDSPSILYDDNGRFAVGSTGTQPLLIDDDTHPNKDRNFNGLWMLKADAWKPTIRKALAHYITRSK